MNFLLVMPKNAAKSPGGYNVFPVGIAYVSAYFKAYTKYNITTANLEFCDSPTFEALNTLITENDIDVICTSGLSRDYYKIKEIIDISRQIKPGIITVIGGGIISSDPEPAMIALGADIGIIGEGEITLCELAAALDYKSPLENVPGLIFKDNNAYTITYIRKEIDDLESIPLPDYDGFDFPKYMASINYDTAYVIASRSCPFSCTFCFHPSGKKYRQRSMDDLFREIEYLLSNYKVRLLVVSDELFATNKNRVLDFCVRIKKFNTLWSIQLRVCDVNAELLQVMKNSGCYCVSYGLESADDSVLKSMRKHITVSQIENALKLTHDADIDIQGGFIFGDIAETTETANRTLKWNSEHAEYVLELNMINIFPGTPLYNHAVSEGIIRDKVKYLKDGCPLVNVSQLTDKEYADLSSYIYESNMKPRYAPKEYQIVSCSDDSQCSITIKCNKCHHEQTIAADALHNQITWCSKCNQRYLVDAFAKLNHEDKESISLFSAESKVALWGAGEICIKLLNAYNEFNTERYAVVDISHSRQGKTICGKEIFSPSIINEMNITSVIICVVRRGHEIIDHISREFLSVRNIFSPIAHHDAILRFERFSIK
ncbi:MAG: radical SAM protein [Smithella sp.]